jgi:hypothetical protein
VAGLVPRVRLVEVGRRETLAQEGLVAGGGLALVALALAGWVPPLPPCPLRMLGLACPFCGLTRSFLALARGRVLEALAQNPAGPLLFLAVLVALPFLLYSCLTGRRFRPIWSRQARSLAARLAPAALVGLWMYELGRALVAGP